MFWQVIPTCQVWHHKLLKLILFIIQWKAWFFICEKSNVYVNVKCKTNFLIKCSRKTHTKPNYLINHSLKPFKEWHTWHQHVSQLFISLKQSYSKYNVIDGLFLYKFHLLLILFKIDLSFNHDDGMFETGILYFRFLQIVEWPKTFVTSFI